jgi:hypothetical protein
MDEVIARVKGHRDTLLSGSESQISEALAALTALGSLPEQVLGETFVGLAVDKISKDATLPEQLKRSSRELLRFWQDSLHRWKSMTLIRPRTFSKPGRGRSSTLNQATGKSYGKAGGGLVDCSCSPRI